MRPVGTLLDALAALAASALLLGCMQTPPPLPTELAQAQQHEGTPAVAVQEYGELYQRCQRGTATGLVQRKDDCGTVAFRFAQSLERAERYAEAAAVFGALPALSRDRVKIARAQVRAAELQADHLGDREQALKTCRQVIAEVPAEVPAEDALRLLVRLQTEDAPREPSLDPAGAPREPSLDREAALRAELDRLAAELRPYETIASFALLYGGQAAERRGRPDEALARYDEIWKRYPRGPLFDDALFTAAQLLRKLGRSGEAAERLARLAQAYTSAVLVGHYHQERLIESMFLLGQVYLRELNRPDQAITTLQQLLVRQPSSRLADDALLLMAEAALRLQPAARPRACGYLARLFRDYPDSNHQRAAQALQRDQQCPSDRPLEGPAGRPLGRPLSR